MENVIKLWALGDAFIFTMLGVVWFSTENLWFLVVGGVLAALRIPVWVLVGLNHNV